MLYAKFGWNWPNFTTEDFLDFVNVFSYFLTLIMLYYISKALVARAE